MMWVADLWRLHASLWPHAGERAALLLLPRHGHTGLARVQTGQELLILHSHRKRDRGGGGRGAMCNGKGIEGTKMLVKFRSPPVYALQGRSHVFCERPICLCIS